MDERIGDYERYTHPRQHMDNICAEAVRWSVNVALGEDDREKAIGRSLYCQLLREMAKAAMTYAVAKNIDIRMTLKLMCWAAHLQSSKTCGQR